MALQRGKLTDIIPVAATASKVYANPAATKSYIRGFIIHNTNTTSETVEIHNVPDASNALGTPVALNRFLKAILTADDTLFIELDYPIVLTDTNDAFFAKSTTASKVTLQLLGDTDA